MIVTLTVALAAGVVWWVTSGEIPSFFTGRRGGRPTTPPFGGEISGPGSTAAPGWPRAHTEARPRRAPEGRRGGVVRHRPSRSTFTYAPMVKDHRPPVPLTILKIVFIVLLVAGLLAAGIWAMVEFLTSFIEKLLQ